MADIITPILNVVALLCGCSGNNTNCYLLDLKENKDALKTAMEKLKDTRDDVKRRVDEAENHPYEPRRRTNEVDGWLKHVQTIEGEVGEILQKADQEIEGRWLGAYCPKNCWSSRKIGKLLIRKLPIVNDLRSKGSFVDVAYKLPPPLVQEEPVDLPVGMEPLFQKVLKSIVEDDTVRIMGLYGNGGVGKTTLLKQINNEFLKNTNTTYGFDVVILVVVSKEVNMNAIRKVIGDRLGLNFLFSEGVPSWIYIFNALAKKKFLLLLDDIWERVDLQSIGIPLRPENKKSKVVFTTRSEIVCGHMDANTKFRVECLPWEKAWTLFQEKVGNDALNSHPDVPELAKDVARECDGLPLALITIGRAMSTKKTLQEWKHAITTLQRAASEFPGMGDKVLPLLKLSYDDLQNETIKSCFLYCALYPEDWSIDKAKLIDHWIGEGLIPLNEFDHIDKARNHGYDVIGILKGACLLDNGNDKETQVKMHDVIRDLALWIACECGGSKKDNNMLTIGMSDLIPERWYNAERIWLRANERRGSKLEVYVQPPKFTSLLTLLYDSSSSGTFFLPGFFFEFMPRLRVLDLSYSKMNTFPTSITELLELQYLSLSWTSIYELPEELRKLVKLKFLDLSHMMYLKKIPSGVIGSLLELRVLNLFGSYRVDWDIEEVYQLKHLNYLGITIKTQHNLNKLLSLSNRNLQMCTTHLQLRMYNPVSRYDPNSNSPSPTAYIRDPDPPNSFQSLKNLELLSNLERLLIQNLRMNMEWENHPETQQHLRSFQNLSEITISECYGLKDLTWVVYVDNLRKLDVESCEAIEEIIVGDRISGMMSVDIFKSLESLKMTHLLTLKSICSQALVFPSLVSMYFFKCPQLKKLPLDSNSNVNNTLQVIEGQQKWWSELQWEDHGNVKSKFLPYIKHLFFFFLRGSHGSLHCLGIDS